MCKKPKETEKQQKKRAFTGNLQSFASVVSQTSTFFYFHVLHRGGIVMPIIDWRL